METYRKIKKIVPSKKVIDGAGVKINRIFGFSELPQFDPFLLLDHFKSEEPSDYMAGFPWHPHRGIETVTYMLKGVIEHTDSLGNSGIIGMGDVQWMTAGSGIIHQEMPKSEIFGIEGFQLWVNLNSKDKMCAPAYQGIAHEKIPVVINENKVKVSIISGEFNNYKGAIKSNYHNYQFWDIVIPPNTAFDIDTSVEDSIFTYIYKGTAIFTENINVEPLKIVQYEEGSKINIKSGKEEVGILLIAGKPINEKIAWRGPIVMNTEEELLIAYAEYDNNAFIREKY